MRQLTGALASFKRVFFFSLFVASIVFNGVVFTPNAHAATCNVSGTQTIDQTYVDSNSCSTINISGTITITWSGTVDLVGAGDVNVTSGTVTFSGAAVLGSTDTFSVSTGATVTHAAESATGLSITASAITISSGAIVDANGKGCGTTKGPDNSNVCSSQATTSGDTTPPGGEGGDSGNGAGGAGYGGIGGNGDTGTTGGGKYGRATYPSFLGSGGGTGNGGSDTGGAGGGLIQLISTNNTTIDGTVRADGSIGAGNRGGGGSGGSVYIRVGGTVSGSGIIQAKGGSSGGSALGGAGGGGRVAMYYTSGTPTTLLSNATVVAGTSGGLGMSGSILFAADPDNDSLPSNGLSVSESADDSWTFTSAFDLNSNDDGVNDTTVSLTLNNLTINSTAPGVVYSGVTAINLMVDNALTVSGNGSFSCANTSIAEFNWSSIASFSWADYDFTCPEIDWGVDTDMSFTGSAVITASKAEDADAMTVNGNSSGNKRGLTLSNTSQWVGNLLYQNATTITVNTGTIMNASGKGCGTSRGPDNSNVCSSQTTGADTTPPGGEGGDSGNYAGGGGYGGIGGTGNAAGGGTYGVSTAPTFLGSGGGTGNGGSNTGGTSGGLIQMVATGNIAISGTIKADGVVGTGVRSGGGSGGSVYLISYGTVSGTGVVQATGSSGGEPSAGAGGGGRIALYYVALDGGQTVTSNFSVIAGTTGQAGGVGSTYTFQYAAPVTPSVTAPADLSSGVTRRPTVTSSAYSSDGATHTSSDWKVTTDAGGSDIVWSKTGDAGNLVSIVVNTANGTFSGALAGLTQLDVNTTYHVFVRHTNAVGSSSWSSDSSFTTVNTSVTVTETGGTAVTEGGATDTYTLVLASQPTADVIITASPDAQVSLSAPTFTFTDLNWSTPQTVTVTAVNDAVAEGLHSGVVAHTVSSVDTNYDGVAVASVTAAITDNDSAGITIGAISGNTTEAGGTATFTAVLTSQPTADVTFGLSSSNLTEGTVLPASLTFTSGNWSTPQTVTVTGVNDDYDDGDVVFSIVTAAAGSADGGYDNMNASDVSVTNTDNDTAGVSVVQSDGSTDVTEGGGTDSYTLVLTARPTADVTITPAPDAQVSRDPATRIFTNANWNTPQTITVTAVNDFVAEGGHTGTITHSSDSVDVVFAGLVISSVVANVTDNDTANITVSAISGNTTEAGGTATFTVVLDSEPTDDVLIGISSSDTTEGTVSAASLTFTALNWSDPQTITVTGVNDDVDDGDIAYSILTAAAVSDDPTYNGLNPDNVSVTNTDNDTANITVSAISGNTTEAGGTATFTVVLTSEPTDDVTIGVSSNDTTEGTVSTASLTFTSLNWSDAQTITVTGINDDVDDGNIAYTIVTAAAVSDDPTYNGVNPDNVSVTNTDNDTANITVSAISGNTTEAGGTATFTVVLDSEPTDDVLIGISSSDTTEGTVSAASVTFTALNWSDPQTITVTGVNDDVDDGNVDYTILTAASVSDDPNYNLVNPSDVGATNTDNDTANITVSAISGNTTEAGGTATFTVVLTSEPTNDVVIGISSSDTTEGTVAPASITFTALNWDDEQTVTVTGVNDDVDDGNIAYSIITAAAVSDDLNYNNFNPSDVGATNTDNDTAGLTVSAISGNTSEAGGTATFTVVLTSEPTNDVLIGISSSDTTEGTVSTASLTFTALNWDDEQTITVTGVNDDVDDGDIDYTILTAAAVSDDPNYDGLASDDVAVANTDDDGFGITVSPISGDTSEAGATATFTIVLDSEPTADVVIDLSSSDITEGTIDPALFIFTALNWSDAQTVTVTGVGDLIDDGNVAYSIIIDAAISDDPNYNGEDPANIPALNTDDDSAGATLVESDGSTTVEEGATTDTYTLVLLSEPTEEVTVTITADAQVTADPAVLTFTAENWDEPQTVTVTAVDDSAREDETTGTLSHAFTSLDEVYDGLVVADVVATVIDDDRSSSARYTPPVVQPALTLLSPEEGTEVVPSERVRLSWSSRGDIPFVNVQYSLNAGRDWTTDDTVSNSLSTNVVIPQIAEGEIWWRLQGTDLATTSAESNELSLTVISSNDSTTESDEDTNQQESTTEDTSNGTSSTIPANTLIKLPDDGDPQTSADSSVYYVGSDGHRHAFPNSQVYFSWYEDFSDLMLITKTELSQLPLGKNITYRPGTKMVKFQTSPKVYVIDRYGVLRWIATEAIAEAYYGAQWNTNIDDISDAFFSNYTFGGSIEDVNDYSPAEAAASVATPDDNFPLTISFAKAFFAALSLGLMTAWQ